MLVIRDILKTIQEKSQLEALLLWGPRQVGKTTLLDQLPLKSRAFLDDIGLRQKAQQDPTFFLDDLQSPSLIDEVQYASNLFPEIKKRIDETRRKALHANQPASKTQYYLTGSNKTLLDKNVKESLAGRCHLISLHGFSVKEIHSHFEKISLKTILLRGGFPELYTREGLPPKQFFNDYITSFVEKDIAYSSGIEKIDEFQTVLKLLAARTGQFLNTSEIAKHAGINIGTISSWIGLLKQNGIIDLVPSYATNLTKRLVKMKKLYFYDTGLCARLQSQETEDSLWNSAQAGALFETLVFSEIVKTKENFWEDWQLQTWRTKEKREIDFVLTGGDKTLLIEAKLGIHSAKPFDLDPEAQKVFGKDCKKVVVTAGGNIENLNRSTQRIPIFELGQHLLKNLTL